MALNKPRVNVNWILFGVAIALGIGAVYLSNSLLKSRMAEIEETAKRGQQTIDVVVAKRDLQRGDAITEDAVAVRSMPKQYVQEAAIKPDQFGTFENQRLAVPIKRGEAMLTSEVEGNGVAVFSATLRKGLRALTFEVDAVNSISGMLRPGDRIDLIFTSRGSESAKEMTLPLLSNVQVLATDQNLTKRDDGTGKERNFSTITLEVAPLDADRIIVAKASGTLTAVLRHPEDNARNSTVAMTAAQLTSGASPTSEGRTVEYIVGGGGTMAEVTLSRLLPALNQAAANPAALNAAKGQPDKAL